MTQSSPPFAAAQEPLGRRLFHRFPVILETEYRLVSEPRRTGRGQTVNLSRKGVLLELEETVPQGRIIELSIVWPVKLDGEVSLILWGSGRTVRCQGKRVAVHLSRYEFRTRRRQPAMQSLTTGGSRVIAAAS